ncbi:MAG: hypothetical protein K6F42_06915, partial [Bacteroidales bacterium]|nr:hypothetical protein [Bacteroidales bacterium]
MKNGKYSSVWIALLGIVVGALLVVTLDKYRETKAIRIRGNEWQKLNLVLENVAANYVDTVDYKGATEAAIVAALSKL